MHASALTTLAGTRPSASALAAACSLTGVRIDEYAEEVLDRAREAIPSIPMDLHPAVVAGCEALTQEALERLPARDAHEVGHLPDHVAGLAVEFAQRGLAIEDLLAVVHLWHSAFAAGWLDAVTERDHGTGLHAYGSSQLFAFAGRISRLAASTFSAERARWSRSAEARKGDEVAAIVERGAEDPAASSGRLGYPLDRRHVAMVLWRSGSEPAPLADLADAVAVDADAGPLLKIAVGRDRLHAWLVVGAEPPEPGRALRAALRSAGAALAFGEPADGVDGFVRSHRQALEGQRVAKLAHRLRPVTRFGDVSLLGMLARDADDAEAFITRTLGPLREETARNRRLVLTLCVFLEEGASHIAASRRLNVHVNTITYRVRRAGELLGRPVEAGALELHAALALHSYLHLV